MARRALQDLPHGPGPVSPGATSVTMSPQSLSDPPGHGPGHPVPAPLSPALVASVALGLVAAVAPALVALVSLVSPGPGLCRRHVGPTRPRPVVTSASSRQRGDFKGNRVEPAQKMGVNSGSGTDTGPGGPGGLGGGFKGPPMPGPRGGDRDSRDGDAPPVPTVAAPTRGREGPGEAQGSWGVLGGAQPGGPWAGVAVAVTAAAPRCRQPRWHRGHSPEPPKCGAGG